MLENSNNGMIMPVQPMNGGYGYSTIPVLGGLGGLSGLGGDLGSFIVLFLIAVMFGGFGGMGFGGGFGGFGNMMLGYDFPWLLTGQQNINTNTNNGFRDAMINDNITSVRDGISSLSTQICGGFGDTQMSIANSTAALQNSLCNGFNGVNSTINTAQNAIAQQLYNNEIANLNRSFAEQTANVQGFTNVNSGIADTRYTIASEACATRQTDTQNTQSILNAINGGIQSIKDQLCQDKIDAKNDEIAQLRQENLYARGQASQIAQNSAIINGIYDRLQSCPVGTVPVYGEQPIFTCNNNGGCPCSGNNFNPFGNVGFGNGTF